MPQFSCLKNENGRVVMVAVGTEISVDTKKRIIAKIYIIYTVTKYYSKWYIFKIYIYLSIYTNTYVFWNIYSK